MNTRHFYLTLCVPGLLIPNSALLPWVVEHGANPGLFLADLFANGVSAFFALDVLLSAITLSGFVLLEGRRLRIPHPWLPILATCLFGVSFGLPLFLYQRQVCLERARS
jgi:hypothetical protein